MGETVVEEQQEAEAVQEVRSPADDRNMVALEEIKAAGGDWRSKQPSEYGVKDFLAYAENYKVLDNPFQLDPLEQLLVTALSGPIGLIQKATGSDTIIETFIKKQKAKKASQVNEAVNNILETGEMDGQPLTSEANNILFSAQFEANNVAAANDPFGQTTGTPIYDQPYYQDVSNLITKSEDSIISNMDLSKLAPPTGLDTDGDGMADLFPPKEEALVIPKGKYDPTSTSLAGGAKNNLLTEKEQPAFDNAVDSGDNSLAAHFVTINRLRNKKEDFAEQYASASEKEKARLMSADRVDGLSIQDREQAIASVVTQPEPEEEEDKQPETTSSSINDDGPSVAEQLAEQNRISREANLPKPRPSNVSNVEDRTSIISESLADKKAREEKEAIKKYKDKVIAGGGTWATGGR